MVILKGTKAKIKITEAHSISLLADAVVRAIDLYGNKIQVGFWTNKLNKAITGKVHDSIMDTSKPSRTLFSIGGLLIIEISAGEFRILTSEGEPVESHKIKSFSADFACVWITCTDGAYLKIYNK